MSATSIQLPRMSALLSVMFLSSLGWGYLWYGQTLMDTMPMDQLWMPPPEGHPWTNHDFAMTFAMWLVMTVAMMTPSVLPMLMGYLGVRQKAANFRWPSFTVWSFLLGYFLTWLLYCAVVTCCEWQLHFHGLLTPMMESRSLVLSGAILVAAGVYQLTPWKAVCLKHCRFSKGENGDCHRSAFATGTHHGANCMGSCGVLMPVMFAVGMMNLVWMAILTGVVILEKGWPWSPTWIRVSLGLGLLGWGGWTVWQAMQ